MANPQFSGNAPAFPKRLALPRIERPVQLPVAAFAEVKSAADLPSRLFLGDREEASFCVEKRGWSAEWRDAAGHRTRFRYAGKLSSLALAFDGDEVVMLTQAERFDALLHTLQTLLLGVWIRRLGETLEAEYNVRAFAPREEEGMVSDFPDGPLITLVLPVPADRLLALHDLHQALAADAAIRTPVRAYVRYGLSVVNYIEGRNHPMLTHPVGLVMHHVNALGAPAADLPRPEENAVGERAWTLQRSHYVYIAHVYLREVERFVERLAEAGFIARVGAGAEGYPYGPEFGAVLLPFGYEYLMRNAWWFDRAHTRRMFYPRFADAEDSHALAGSGALEDRFAHALIRDAQNLADRFKADAARVFAEGVASGLTRREALRLH